MEVELIQIEPVFWSSIKVGDLFVRSRMGVYVKVHENEEHRDMHNSFKIGDYNKSEFFALDDLVLPVKKIQVHI